MCETERRGPGRVVFVGAGPADDLITLRGARLIGEADVVVWSPAALSQAAVQEHARIGVELVDGTRVAVEQAIELYRRAAAHRLVVARVVPGDTASWPGLGRHVDAARRLGLGVEVVPGVTALSAVVAATGRELTEPAVVVPHLDHGLGEPGVFDAAAAGSTSGSGASDGSGASGGSGGSGGAVAVTASASRVEALVAALRAGGRADDTPVVVGHKAGRADEVVVSTTLGEVERVVKRHRLWLPALFLVGRAPARAAAPRHHTVPAAAPYRRRRRDTAGDAAADAGVTPGRGAVAGAGSPATGRAVPSTGRGATGRGATATGRGKSATGRAAAARGATGRSTYSRGAS